MQPKKLEQFLRAIGSRHIKTGGQWVKASCPLSFKHRAGRDEHPSFGVLSKPPHGYHCYACGSRGRTLDALIADLMHNQDKLLNTVNLAFAINIIETDDDVFFEPSEWEDTINEISVTFWPEQYLALFQPAWENPDARDYLKSRGINKAHAEYLELRYDNQKEAVCFPLRYMTGELCGMRGRRIDPEAKVRYHDYVFDGNNNTSHVWIGEHHSVWDAPIVVVEGPFDYASVSRVYRNVLGALSVSFNLAKARRLDAAVKLIMFFDNDEAGEAGRDKLTDIVTCACYSVRYPENYPKDPGGMTEQQLRKVLSPLLTLP